MQQFIDKLISSLKKNALKYKKDDMAIGINVAIDIVNQLAKEYKGGWIPCSVELPKYMERAITCDEKGNIHVFHCDGKYFRDECCKRITENHERYYIPIAWMPLPEPYRKDGE